LKEILGDVENGYQNSGMRSGMEWECGKNQPVGHSHKNKV
jgi:hypothetical protein